MATLTSVTNHFPKPKEGFITTLSSTIGVAAATVPLTSTSGLTNGDIFVGIIDPTTSAKQAFTGTVDTAGNQITGVVWTEGTNVGHTVGATVVDYVAATSVGMISKGILVEHGQTGVHSSALITSRTEDTSPDVSADFLLSYDTSATALKKVKPTNFGLTDGWIKGQIPAVSSVTYNGNRSYDITFASTVASLLTPGMRIRTTRTVTAPTYMGGAFNGTNHYFTKTTATSTLSTITDNITIVGWAYPTAYGQGFLCGRSDATPATGFGVRMESTGQITFIFWNAGAGNNRSYTTYQSLPLNKKTHIAVSYTSTGTACTIYFDGVSVPVGAAVTGGTAPTTFGAAAADFSVGRLGAFNGQYWTGYLSGVGVFNVVLTAATIKSYIPQVLSGSETNCIGAWSLNNTGVNQQAAGTNDLTATNSVSYTSGVAPYATDANGVAGGTYDFAIVQKVATTVATVQVPEGCAIPTSGGVTTVDLAPSGVPFGFPADKGRWEVSWLLKTTYNSGAVGANVITNIASAQLSVPVGQWELGFEMGTDITHAGSTYLQHQVSLSTSNSAVTDYELHYGSPTISASLTEFISKAVRSKRISISTATVYYLISFSAIATTTQYFNGISSTGASYIKAIPSNL